jgi:lipoprotein-releasing system permease protein
MYKVVLALRYLLKRRITYFAVLAVALCVFIVAVVMTVMTGLVGGFKQKNHDFVGDCVVGTPSLVGFAYYEEFVEVLESSDSVESVSPVIKSYALLRRREGTGERPVEIMGIDPVRHGRATGFGETLYYRRDNVSKAFEPIYDPNLLGCVLGIDLALARDEESKYSYDPSPARVGLVISCVPLSAQGAPAKEGLGLVNTQTFFYSDHSQSGLARVDNSLIYLPFEQAQLLCGMGVSVRRASAIHVKFSRGVAVRDGCRQVASLWREFREGKAAESQAYLLDTVTVQSWKEYRRGSIAPMEKEQMVMSVMFGFVGITTVFIVLVVFYMIISDKSKDIGILKSVGASNLDVVELFSLFSFLVGLTGSVMGLFGGWLFLLNINRIEDWLFRKVGFQLWDRTIFAIGDIPSQIEVGVLIVIAVSAIAACLVGALLPSWRAARLRPVDSLQVSQL